jgi:predicted Zn-dependent peptidase
MREHFLPHPLGQNVLGTPSSVTALKRQDMQDYFDRRYAPGNVALVAVGNFDWPALLEQVREACGHWVDYSVDRQRESWPGSRKTAHMQDAKLLRQHVGLMSSAPSAQSDQRYSAHLLAAILGDVTGSRLFYALVEPAIAEEASCSYDELDGAGAFLTFLSASPQRAGQALDIARGEYQKFLQAGPTESELVAAKNKIASSITLRGELPMGRLTAVGFEWVYRKTYGSLAQHVECILAVTARQVLEVARQHDLLAATTVTLGPRPAL